MKKILFDANVVLDVLLDREPHVASSAAAWAVVETGRAQGMICAHAVTTIHYLIRKERRNAKAGQIITAILRVFAVAAVDFGVFQEALQLPFPDLEDAVTAAVARQAGCDFILTRDPKGFRGSPVRAVLLEAFLLLPELQ